MMYWDFECRVMVFAFCRERDVMGVQSHDVAMVNQQSQESHS